MNKLLKLIAFSAFFIFGTSACNLNAASPSAATSTSAALPATQTAAPSPAAPGETPTATASLEAQFAPICEPGAGLPTPAQCREITAVETSVMCAKKKPFNIIVVNPGDTYKALTSGFFCTDGGIRDGKQFITCTGNMASTYQVQVCDPSCALPTAVASTTQCPDGYQYDALRGCCTAEFILLQQNCRVFEFTSTTCKVNCGENKTKKACFENSYACLWIQDKKLCVNRQ